VNADESVRGERQEQIGQLDRVQDVGIDDHDTTQVDTVDAFIAELRDTRVA
jgi:hypothetical protein